MASTKDAFAPAISHDAMLRSASAIVPRGKTASSPICPTDTALQIWVQPWRDEINDLVGHDPKSPYVERFWLSYLGPSSTWMIRLMSYGFDANPGGFAMSIMETARALGIGDRTGRHSPFNRALARLCLFEMGRRPDDDTLILRRKVPWLEPRQVRRLSPALQHEHGMWEDAEAQTDLALAMKRRSSTVAMATIRSGGTTADAQAALARAGVDSTLILSLPRWAAEQWALIHPEMGNLDAS